MFKKYLSGVLIVVLSLALSTTGPLYPVFPDWAAAVVDPIVGAAAAVWLWGQTGNSPVPLSVLSRCWRRAHKGCTQLWSRGDLCTLARQT